MNVKAERKRIDLSIKTTKSVDPEYILWNNIGYSAKSRLIRKIVSMSLALFIIIISSIIIYFVSQNKHSEVEECDMVEEKEGCLVD